MQTGWDSALRQQSYPGDKGFGERMQALADTRSKNDSGIPTVPRQRVRTLAH